MQNVQWLSTYSIITYSMFQSHHRQHHTRHLMGQSIPELDPHNPPDPCTLRTKLRSDTGPNQWHVWLCLYNLPGFRVSSRAELPPTRFKVLCRNRDLLIIDPHLKLPPDEKNRNISQGIKLLTSTTDWLNFKKASTCWNLHNTCMLFPLVLVAKHYVYGVHLSVKV
jgi:hypothetical protein